MAEIFRLPLLRHLRAEPSAHILHFRGGDLVRSGRGLTFWFRPLSAGIAQIPVDDRDQSFLFEGRTADFQDVAVQGTLTFRVVEPEILARHVDFGIDLDQGRYLHEPLEQLATIVTQLAQQVTLDWLTQVSVRVALRDGVAALREKLHEVMVTAEGLAAIGIEVAAARVTRVSPTAELEKALQAPTREAIQQESDEATFQRRALAVEKERAIAENELQSKIELARRETVLIEQEGANARERAEGEAEASRIVEAAAAESTRIGAAAEADGIRFVEGARNEAEAVRIDTYRDLPAWVLLGLAAQEFAGKVESIHHLNVGSNGLGVLLQDLITAGTERLEKR